MRRLCASTLLLCGSVLAGASAWAQAGAACNPQGSTEQVNACAVRDFQAADIALNIRYLETMQALPPEKRPALRQQQNGWIKSRVARCKADHRAQENQPDWPQRYNQCLVQLTTARQTALGEWR